MEGGGGDVHQSFCLENEHDTVLVGFNYDHGCPQKFFQGGQSRNFAYPFQVVDDERK